jgi:dimethylglycine dehydrogenase
VHEVTDADPLGNEPLFDEKGAMVGRATAGGYGHAVRQSIAIGYVQPKYSAVGTRLGIEILGKRHPATVVQESPYDPENLQLRS